MDKELINKLINYLKYQDDKRFYLYFRFLLIYMQFKKMPLALPPHEENKESNLVNDVLANLSNFKNPKLQIKEDKVTLDERLINNLINKFLKLYYRDKKSDLNNRSKNDFYKTYGYYYWDKKAIARHLVTKDYNKILNDKYDITYNVGKENIPLAFYFDLSDSMTEYTDILAYIALSLLHNNIKVLIGFNEKIFYQINNISPKVNSEYLKYYFDNYYRIVSSYIDSIIINENIDTYLINKRCERCVIFSDQDSYKNICNLVNYCQVYLYYFLTYGANEKEFNGVYFEIKNKTDIAKHLIEMANTSYHVLKERSLSRIRSKKE